MKLLITTTFALAATFSAVSAESSCSGGCNKKKANGCKKGETALVTKCKKKCKKSGCEKEKMSECDKDKKSGGCSKGGCKKSA